MARIAHHFWRRRSRTEMRLRSGIAWQRSDPWELPGAAGRPEATAGDDGGAGEGVMRRSLSTDGVVGGNRCPFRDRAVTGPPTRSGRRSVSGSASGPAEVARPPVPGPGVGVATPAARDRRRTDPGSSPRLELGLSRRPDAVPQGSGSTNLDSGHGITDRGTAMTRAATVR